MQADLIHRNVAIIARQNPILSVNPPPPAPPQHPFLQIVLPHPIIPHYDNGLLLVRGFISLYKIKERMQGKDFLSKGQRK